MSGFRDAGKRLVSSLYRRPKEAEVLGAPFVRHVRWVAFGTLSALLLVPLALSLSRDFLRWENFAADPELPRTQWSALYETSPASCGVDAAAEPACLASPSNARLWQSPLSLVSQDEHKRRVQQRGKDEYWIGTTISAAQAATAAARGANFLTLGQIRGAFTLWIDGKQMMSGGWLDSEPVVVQLPLTWLAQRRALRLAVRLTHTVDINDAPDLLEYAPRLGFVTKFEAADWKRYWNFWASTRPLTFVMLNLLLAWVFFGIWCVAPEKPEYFYIAVLAMCFAFYQMRRLDFVYLTTHRQLLNAAFVSHGVLNAFSGMLLGFAFARLRRSIMVVCLVVCGVLAVALPLLVRDSIQQQILSYRWLSTGTDAGTLLGALACFIQAIYLWYSGESRVRLGLRIRRLALFGGGLVLLTAVNLWPDTGVPNLFYLVFGKSGPFFLLLWLGVTALSEFRTEHSLAQAMPISQFHRLDPLPESIHGVLVSVDLIDSEGLSRVGARLGRAGDLVETCLSHLWTAVTQNGGVILQSEGDALRALFPAAELGDPLAAAFAAVVLMKGNLALLEARFASQGLKANLPINGLQFRGALVEGHIRPIWQAYGGARLAGWVESGHTNAFVEAARLLDLGRRLSDSKQGTSVVVTLSELGARFDVSAVKSLQLFENRKFTGKHGREYEIAAFQVNRSSAY